MSRPVVAFDIEVVGTPWEQLDEATRGYLLNRARSPEDRESVPEKTALVPGIGKVVAIAFWRLDRDTGGVLLEGEDSGGFSEWDQVPGSMICTGEEATLLKTFWEKAKDYGRLVSYYGRGYDGPVLLIRSAMHGIAPSRKLAAGYRYSIGDHCDLFDVLSFHGSSGRYSLDYWCRRFGVESPKGSLDGSQVGAAYREGRIMEIGEYCLRDARATARLYQALEPTLLPLFRDR